MRRDSYAVRALASSFYLAGHLFNQDGWQPWLQATHGVYDSPSLFGHSFKVCLSPQ